MTGNDDEGDDPDWETVPADEGEGSSDDTRTGSADDGDADGTDRESESQQEAESTDEREEPGVASVVSPSTDLGERPREDPDGAAADDGTDGESGADGTDEAGREEESATEPETPGTGPPSGDVADGTRPGGVGDAVLRTENLTKRFGELVAVDGVDLSIERGEFRSVIGPNGAGKTTLFNLITGALAPSEGVVYFDGEDVTGLAPHERVRRGLGRSFQITNVFAGLTVRENVRLAAQSTHREEISSIQRFVRSKDRFGSVNETTGDVLERIGLASHADERAATLAYGDRRRLEIGLVLATDPAVILLDEPTAGMSVDETRETMELIGDVLADRTLMLIEHDIDLVMNVSDRVTVLNRGSVLTTGTPREVADDESVQEAYLGGARP